MNSFVVLQQFRLLFDLFDLSVCACMTWCWTDKFKHMRTHTHRTQTGKKKRSHTFTASRVFCTCGVCALRFRNFIIEKSNCFHFDHKNAERANTRFIDWLRFWFGILHSANFPRNAMALLLLCINHIGDTDAPEHYEGATCIIRVNRRRTGCWWEPSIQHSSPMWYKQKTREKISCLYLLLKMEIWCDQFIIQIHNKNLTVLTEYKWYNRNQSTCLFPRAYF